MKFYLVTEYVGGRKMAPLDIHASISRSFSPAGGREEAAERQSGRTEASGSLAQGCLGAPHGCPSSSVGRLRSETLAVSQPGNGDLSPTTT